MFDKPLPGFDDACLGHALPFTRPVVEPGTTIVFRPDDDAFLVDEHPAYTPAGSGEHLYLHIEKRGMSTPALVKQLCARFGLDERDVGYAGRKDARGVTRQWLSVPARIVEPRVAELSQIEGVRVLEVARHGNKLRLGHLRGNAFTVHLRAPTNAIDVAALEERARTIVELGVPNLFGAQRFGPGDDSVRQAERFLAKRFRARSRRDEFLVSVAQSSLFNAWLADRISDGTWRTPLDGDVMQKVPSGAPFVCTDPTTDAARVKQGEIVVAGPLVGRAMRSAERDALTRESRCFEALGVHMVDLMSHPSFDVGARRAACIPVTDLRVTAATDGVSLEFFLPKGSYASVVVRAWIGPALADAAFVDASSD